MFPSPQLSKQPSPNIPSQQLTHKKLADSTQQSDSRHSPPIEPSLYMYLWRACTHRLALCINCHVNAAERGREPERAARAPVHNSISRLLSFNRGARAQREYDTTHAIMDFHSPRWTFSPPRANRVFPPSAAIRVYKYI